MKGIPPEIDALMWRLAEEGGKVARAEFESRHVRYGPELSRRIRMVDELRAAGKTRVHRPAFTPRPARVAPASRWAVGAALGMSVFAVGAIAYVVASEGRAPLVEASATPRVAPIGVPKPAPTPAPAVRRSQEPVAAPVPVPEPQTPPGYLTPRDVKIEDTALTAAIGLVAAGGGLKVTLAPGFEDRKVTFDYRGAGLNTVETLRAMGEEYGFSVLEEEEGHYLVLPVRETSEPSRRIGG